MSDVDKEVEKKDPAAQQKRWSMEIEAAKKHLRDWHKEGDAVIRKFLDDRKGEDSPLGEIMVRLNLFHSNIVTMMSMLYGRIPKVEVNRRFADADDDVARVAGEILTRILNTDIEVAGEDIASVFRNGLQDRLLPGLGTARLQYQFRSEKAAQTDGGDESGERIVDEWVDIIYTYWKDVLWSPVRTYPELRWKAYRSYLNKKKFKKRFPKADINRVSFTSKGPLGKSKSEDGADANNPQVEVWEIWCEDEDCVYWWTEGYPQILDYKEDILELDGFYPEPPPLIANVTTSKYMPRSDYALAQDLYREIDELETRISILTEACKLVGVYDKNNKGIERIFQEGVENDLIPVDNWAAFAEKGGLKGCVDWIPLDAVTNAIDVLTAKQGEKIQKLQQVTGMNDIMRGAAQTSDRTSATRDKLEANFGSIRIEALQNEFARWVGDLQALKVEIIAKHYQTESIIQQSNILATTDGQDQNLIQQAIQLIKDPQNSRWRITVRPETLAIADYAQLKQDRMEYIMGLSQFLQSAGPVLELEPGALPTLMKLLKWGLSGFRGSNEIEGILDKEIDRIERTPAQPKSDPGAQKAQMEMQKLQMEMQQAQQEFQGKMQLQQQKAQMELQEIQADMQGEREKRQMEIQQTQQQFQLQMQQMLMEHQLEMKKLMMELQAKKEEQAAQFAFNTAERSHEAAVQIRSGNEELERDRERAKLQPKPSGNGGS